MLKISPILGRAWTRAEDDPATRVVLLTDEAWQRYFNRDRNILGKQIRLALNPYTIIGIMPPGFRFPVGTDVQYLIPLHPLVASAVKNRGAHFMRAIGRLKPGVSVATASAEAKAIAARLEK